MIAAGVLVTFFSTCWDVTSAERPRGNIGTSGRSEHVFIAFHSLQGGGSRKKTALRPSKRNESMWETFQRAVDSNVIVETHLFPFSRGPTLPYIDRPRCKECKYHRDCSNTRYGIGRQGVPLYWIFAVVVPVGAASLIVAALSLKPNNKGKLEMNIPLAATAMLCGVIVNAFIGYVSVRISAPAFSDLCLLMISMLGAMLCTIGAAWFGDVEIAAPRFHASAFSICTNVMYFLILYGLNVVNNITVPFAQFAQVPQFVLFVVWDTAESVSCLISSVLPRGVGALLWVCWLWKYYIGFFYWWDDTTGEEPSQSFGTRFSGFALVLTLAMVNLAIPYSRDRYFITILGLLFQMGNKIGYRKWGLTSEVYDGLIVPIQVRVVEVIIVISLCSIAMRYQIALPPRLQKVKYVRLGYLNELRRLGQRVSRSQEVPEAAFGNAAKVVHLIIVSHHWLDAHSCDVPTPEFPGGLRLNTICHRLEQFFPMTWSACSELWERPISTFLRIVESAVYSDDDVLIFFDFMSLPQIGIASDGMLIDRTSEEAALFKEVLPACGLLYTMFPVLVCPEVSEGVTPYMSSGWCFCEWEQAQLCGTLRPYSETVEHECIHPDTGSGFQFIEKELEGKLFRCEADRDVVRDIVKGTWIRSELLAALVSQDIDKLRDHLKQLYDYKLQYAVNFPADASTLDTLLHIARKTNAPTEFEMLLLENGADPTLPNHRGEHPGDVFIFPRSWFSCLL